MIRIRRYGELGAFKNAWLDARYHFSFSGYYDPAYTGLGALKVINDDIVAAGGGFGMHPHRDMEIITYVRSGAISHRDSLGNAGRTAAGEVQVMSAGTGITHAEHNHENAPTNLYQIWIAPSRLGVAPRWETKAFPTQSVTDALPLLVSGRESDAGKDALFIHQDAAIFGGRLERGTTLRHVLSGDAAYLLVSAGSVRANEEELAKGDGAAITGEEELALHAIADAEILLIEVPHAERAAA